MKRFLKNRLLYIFIIIFIYTCIHVCTYFSTNNEIVFKMNSTAFMTVLLFLIVHECHTTVFNHVSSGNSNKINLPVLKVDLEPINGTSNYRIYGKNGKDDKPWFDGRGLDMRHIQCVRRARCERLSFNSCLGAKIPYEYTSLDLTDYQSQSKVQERLLNYRALQHVPKCWAVIQQFLCAVLVPKCEHINDHDMVYLPSLEMCRLTLEPCRILYNTSYFPEFLRCNESLFPSRCINDVREMKFNLSARCLEPLVPADNSGSYYPGIEGCGIQCKDPLYTSDEHRQIHKLIGWGGSLCFLANFFVVATFFIDWENANRYPALIVFYINLCLLIVCAGWLAQFTSGSREDIVCKKDGTLRSSEPTAGENLSCVVVFVLIYYFLMAAMVWFIFLTYTWHLRAVGNVQDRIDKKGSYFHLVAWSLPLILTITTLALSEVDGNSTVGICFVGYLNHTIRTIMLLAPLIGVVVIGGYFIIRGMIMLFGLKNFANDIKSTLASNKIHLIIVRMGLCALFTLVFIIGTIACHISEFRHSQAWANSFRRYIICSITAQFTDDHVLCKLDQRPSVAILQLHLLCLFGTGIVMSTWCWTPSSLQTWKRFIKRKCGKDVMQPCQMAKHKVIAQTWAKRKELEEKGRLSITLYNTHTDPVGLNFDVNDLNSSETNEISSTWANYLPQFVKRRMALTGVTTNNNSSSQDPRKNSLDSEISISLRHVSVESRRTSVDSQVSVKIAEMKTKVASRSRNRHYHHNQHKYNAAAANKRSQRRRDFISSTTGRKYSRRESSTSMESQIIALKKNIFSNTGGQHSQKLGLYTKSTKRPNAIDNEKQQSKRRSGNGFDPSYVSDFLAKNGQLFIPFLQNHESSSDAPGDHNEINPKLNMEFKKDFSNTCKHKTTEIEELYETNKLTGKHIASNKEDFIDHLLKIMQKSNEPVLKNRNSRNSWHSESNKSQSLANSQNSSLPKHKEAILSEEYLPDIILHRDSISSYSSEELNIPHGLSVKNSFSGHSISEKPLSRNSKTSCDVGIQANLYDITKQTFNPNTISDGYEKDKNLHKNLKMKLRKEFSEETEMQALLCSKQTNTENGNLRQRETILTLTESEKLKMLLLPTK